MRKNRKRDFLLFGINLNNFLVFFLLLIFLLESGGAVLIVTSFLRQHSLEMAEEKARLILDRNLATHTYFTHELKPALFDLTAPFISEDYFDPTWMSSTYVIRQIETYFQELNPSDYYYKEAAINARSPYNEADSFEREFLESLNENENLTFHTELREIDGQRYFTTLRRGEVMEGSCLRCHSEPQNAPAGLVDLYGAERSFGREKGEVISAISIRIPLEGTYQEIQKLAWYISGLLILFFLVLFLALNWVRVKMVIEPLDRIGQKALLISEHSEHLGEQIKLPAFKEMQKLTEAFNTMSTALKKERDYLEQRVQERTAELEKVKERIQHIATHDALTELPNRRLFEEQFSQAVKLAKRNQDEFSLMMIDLDDFKEINDTYGHVTGDKVLKQFGKRMENILRDSDLVARWGGDEFIILLFNTSKEADMISVVEKVFSTIETPISADKIKLILKMSAGIARYPQDGETEDKLLRHADYALYEAKAQPGNSYHFYRDITSDSSNL
jgi:hypothetical protein